MMPQTKDGWLQVIILACRQALVEQQYRSLDFKTSIPPKYTVDHVNSTLDITENLQSVIMWRTTTMSCALCYSTNRLVFGPNSSCRLSSFSYDFAPANNNVEHRPRRPCFFWKRNKINSATATTCYVSRNTEHPAAQGSLLSTDA